MVSNTKETDDKTYHFHGSMLMLQAPADTPDIIGIA
jgi:hypothetical protein